MKFILREAGTGRTSSVTREAAEAVLGESCVRKLVERATKTNEDVEVHFEGDWDLKIEV